MVSVGTHASDAPQDALAQAPPAPGAVLQCLVNSIGDTHVACAEETVRAVHSALQFYQPVTPSLPSFHLTSSHF